MIHEHQIVVPRTARYYSLGAAAAPLEQLWLVCHGYGQLASRFITYFSAIDAAHRLIVAPEALSRFYLDEASGGTHTEARVGASWMTREDRLSEIDDQARYLDALYTHIVGSLQGAPDELIVLGFSQGAATAARWAVRSDLPVCRLILWGGRLPPDVDLGAHRDRLARMQLTLVVGDRDEYISVQAAVDEQARIQRAGVPVERIAFEGGHRLDKGVLRALAARGGSTTSRRPPPGR